MRHIIKSVCCLALVVLASSCVVTESIFFNEDMSGQYTLIYDLSEMKDATREMDPEFDGDTIVLKKQDTTVVFNDLLEQYKDSIAGLPEEEQKKLEKLRDMSMRFQEDEATGLFKFSISRDFISIDSLAIVNERVEEAMTVAMTFDNKGANAEEMKGSSEANTKAMYSFENNVFKRIQPKSESWSEVEEESEEEIMEDNAAEADVSETFDDMTKDAYYVISYSFPKKIKTISNKEAVISEDGKSFTLKIPWDSLMKNEDLLNVEIELED